MSDEDEPLFISPHGDLILDISQDEHSAKFSYRVDAKVLQQQSKYFENLLSQRFNEGQKLVATLRALRLGDYPDIYDTPSNVLPRVPIINVGRVSLQKAGSLQPLLADFLRAIHGLDLPNPSPPVANLANLAVVADRFSASASLSRFIQKKKYLQSIDARSKGKPFPIQTEERLRQKLLIGLIFDHPSWVTKYSKHIIMRDSMRWRPGTSSNDTLALWWDIPSGIEDELIKRRESILDTINSLQSHFLKLYLSGERQCKLGYDTSLQCDSFQLGEMVRFLAKIDTLRMQGKIYDPSEPTYYLGDIERLLLSLRQCSNYQVDANHAHCGLRSRLLPLLDLVQNQLSLEIGSLDIGICAECWKNHRGEYAWVLAKRPVLWAHPRSLIGNRMLMNGSAAEAGKRGHRREMSSCLSRHIVVRDLFTAVERDWTAREVG